MDALRCPPPDADVTSLSGGERRRVALCRLLLSQPDLLLLDEPTNHLDAESVQWLEQHLEKYPGTVVAVTHDRYFLDNVAQWILELDRGHAYPYEGNYSTYLETKAARLKVEGAKDAKQRKRAGGRARVGPVQPAGPAGQEQGPAAALRGDGRRGRPTRQARLRGDPDPAGSAAGQRRSSRPSSLAKGFGDRMLIEDLCFCLPPQRHRRRHRPERRRQDHPVQDDRRGRAAGFGHDPDRRDGRISYVDQTPRRHRPGQERVGGHLRRRGDYIRVGKAEIPSRAYVAAFGFKGPDQQKPAGVMSGGERNRVNLALTLKQGGNLLLLDEPTNDLDVETLALAGGRAAGVPRLRGHHQPRPLVPRPGRDPHPGLGGRRELVLVRGQLRGLREEQDRAARRRGRPPAPRHLPPAHPRLTAGEPHARKSGQAPPSADSGKVWVAGT